MKYLAYFLLIGGLLGSQVFAQSAPKNQRPVVVSCVSLSCNSSIVTHSARHGVTLGGFKTLPTAPSAIRAQREVILGSFKPMPAKSTRVVLSQVSLLQRTDRSERLNGKADSFSSPSVIVLR